MLIEKEKLIEELINIQSATYMSTCLSQEECAGKRQMIARVIELAKEAPTVDAVEVVHGERSNYCPNCGAKMD